jgi:hypothetical protein
VSPVAASQFSGIEEPVGHRLVRGEPALRELAELSVGRPARGCTGGRAGRQTNPAGSRERDHEKVGRH